MTSFQHPQLDEAGYVRQGRRRPSGRERMQLSPASVKSFPFITSLLFICEEPSNHD